jgi:hypothetical protein
MAFVTLLDPEAMVEWERDYPGVYLKKIKLSRIEATAVFQGLLICIMIQIIAVYLLIQEFSEGLVFKNDRFLLLIPKLISCYYMHNILSKEVKHGIHIMKYTTNHPDYFERKALDFDASDKTDRDDGQLTRITYAFLIGFVQWGIAVSLEIMSIIFLNSLTSYRLIIVCYASLTAIANFDNIFARAFDENPIKNAVHRRLAVTFNRYMMRENATEHREKAQDDSGVLLQSLNWKENPRKNCFMYLLRFIFKTVRIFHVSFFFYFAPVLMLFYQFYQF